MPVENQIWHLIEGRNLVKHYIGMPGHAEIMSTGPSQAPSQHSRETSINPTAQS